MPKSPDFAAELVRPIEPALSALLRRRQHLRETQNLGKTVGRWLVEPLGDTSDRVVAALNVAHIVRNKGANGEWPRLSPTHLPLARPAAQLLWHLVVSALWLGLLDRLPGNDLVADRFVLTV